MNLKKPSRPLLASLAIALALGGCAAPEQGDSAAVQVAAAFYPLQYAAESVGGDATTVTSLTTPGVEAHDVELTARQVVAVTDADLVVYLSGFQPAVDEAVKLADPDKVIDVAQFADLHGVEAGEEDEEAHDHEEGQSHDEEDEESHDHGDLDPHFWLDPVRLAAVTDAIAERLAEIHPDQAETFRQNAATTRSGLTELDTEFSTGLQTCVRRQLFTSHSAFGYLAERYDLEQVGVAGISPNVEPSPARIAEVQQLARKYGATTIFFETAASDAVARSIAQDLGLQMAVLDPIESVSDQSAGEDYPAIMRANLSVIQTANDCG